MANDYSIKEITGTLLQYIKKKYQIKKNCKEQKINKLNCSHFFFRNCLA